MSLLKRLVAPFSPRQAANDPRRSRTTKSRKLNPIHDARNPPVPLNPYRAVSVVPGKYACASVKALRGTRFLVASGEAPTLPMSECDVAKCTCKYTHYEDRRDQQAGDRRQWSSLQSELFTRGGNENRREKKRGRRKTD